MTKIDNCKQGCLHHVTPSARSEIFIMILLYKKTYNNANEFYPYISINIEHKVLSIVSLKYFFYFTSQVFQKTYLRLNNLYFKTQNNPWKLFDFFSLALNSCTILATYTLFNQLFTVLRNS